MKTKLFISTLCLLAIFGTVRAQHEFSFSPFAGLQSLSANLSDNGTTGGGFGGGAGIGYNYNFNKTWSVGLGLDLSYYSSSLKFDRLADAYRGYDAMEKTNFEFTANAIKFSENVSALLLDIPITARYALPVGDKGNSLRFIGGIKFGLPVNCSYTASADNLTTTGYYERENQTYEEIPGVFGSGQMTKHSGNWNAGIAIQLTLEAAYRLAIGPKSGLALGVYFNYGLNDMQNKTDAHPIAFDINGNNAYNSNSILNSKFASSIRPVSFGVKLRFDLGL